MTIWRDRHDASKGPRAHVCMLDRACWSNWWNYGAPLRVHVGKRYFTVWPFTGSWRTRKAMPHVFGCVHHWQPSKAPHHVGGSGEWVQCTYCKIARRMSAPSPR